MRVFSIGSAPWANNSRTACIPLDDGVVQWGPIVYAALPDISTAGQQQFEDFQLVRTARRQSGDQRRKPGMVRVIGIGAQLEQLLNKTQGLQ